MIAMPNKPLVSRATASRARSLYRQALRERSAKGTAQSRGVRGLWKARPDLPADELAGLIEAVERSPESTVIKEDRGIRVIRGALLERDVIIKRYDLDGLIDRLKYVFRPSRARRFWAAARTLVRLDIPTPEPLGYLELYRGPVPVRSYIITAFIKERVARIWIEPQFHLQTKAIRDGLRRDLLNSLLNLYEHAVYHRDTKMSNLLLVAPADNDNRAFLWIDLECVQFGIRPTRHQVVRNLVQINGSLGPNVLEEDRCAFLKDLSPVFPWVTGENVIRKIQRWTAWRLEKERRLYGSPVKVER